MQRLDPMIGVAAAAFIFVATACSTAPHTALEATASVTGIPETATTAASYPPPPERAEIPPPASSPQALWRSGHWTWNGVKYVWMQGHYVQRPSPTAKWIPGYWEQRPEGWIRIEGQWTS